MRAELEKRARSSALGLVGPPLANSRRSNLPTQRPFYRIPFQLSMILPPSCSPPSPPSSERLGGIVEIEAKTQTEIAKPAAERRLGAAEHHRGLFSTLICSAQDSTPYLFRIMEINHCFFFCPSVHYSRESMPRSCFAARHGVAASLLLEVARPSPLVRQVLEPRRFERNGASQQPPTPPPPASGDAPSYAL